MQFVLTDTLDVTHQIYMFNIFALLNKIKLGKKIEMGSELMKHPLVLEACILIHLTAY
jgi:hypothetical protein